MLLAEAAADGDALARLVGERVGGTPLEELLGWAAFEGLRIVTAPGVFVPRARTGLLVRAALDHLDGGGAGRGATDPWFVLDLCCGTGAAAAAIQAARPGAVVMAADLDPAAVACARLNLAPDRVFEGDLFDALPAELRGRIDVIVANAPYVPTGEIAFMPQEARLHEAPMALDGGDDGTRIQRRIATSAPGWLAPGGLLLIETSERQAAVTASHLAAAGLVTELVGDDLLDATAVSGLRLRIARD